MRFLHSEPAQHLKSVAYRFRLPRVLDRPARRDGNWQTYSGSQPGISGATQSQSDSDGEDTLFRRRRLEAILFLAREPISARRLSQYANLADGTEARTLIRHLNEIYDDQGRAFRVEEVASGFQLLTRARFASWLRRLGHVPSEVRLSSPALETLAVVAYRQPVLRADIEAVRGVSCGEILRQLMERDLIRICGRSEELGRPYLYGTTKRFLQTFGLVDLDQLPRAQMLRTPRTSTPTSPSQSAKTNHEQEPITETGTEVAK